MNGFGDNSLTVGNVIPADGVTWTHLAASYNDTTHVLRVYVDGVLAGSTSCSGTPQLTGVGPTIQRIGEGFKGVLDEVRIWSTPYEDPTINSNREDVLVGDEAGLVAYYRFDDGTSFTNGTEGTSMVATC